MRYFPVDETDLAELLKRYTQLDPSDKASMGIHVEDIARIPEFRANTLIPRVAAGLAGGVGRRIFPEQFVYLCAALSSRTSYSEKRKCNYIHLIYWHLTQVVTLKPEKNG